MPEPKTETERELEIQRKVFRILKPLSQQARRRVLDQAENYHNELGENTAVNPSTLGDE